MYFSKSYLILGTAFLFLIAVGMGSISAKEIPEVVSSFKAIIASEEWDSPDDIQTCQYRLFEGPQLAERPHEIDLVNLRPKDLSEVFALDQQLTG